MTVQWFEALPSTQDLIHRHAGAGAEAGTAVAARQQTAGRGSRGRTWTSPRGGLWLSVLCRPPSDPGVEVLSLRVALAVAATVGQRLPGLQLGIKWPNDLMIGPRKAGGILCEARWQGGGLGWVAVGLGLNVANPIPPELEEAAASLASAAPGATPEMLAEPVADAIARAGNRAGPLDPDELADYATRDVLRGRQLLSPVAGTVLGVDRDGSLRVRPAGGGDVLLRSGPITLAGGMTARGVL